MTKGNFVVGTAGHVDHGKSTLVQKLTGIDPDRLPEEKARQMTIELGFAPLKLPSGRVCGVVDVPGHESLVRQMLMGAQGIDLVILTVACDEGPKKQTYEHLSILNLIGVPMTIVALTKCDMVYNDAELQTNVDLLVSNSIFEKSPRIKVSAYSGEGIDKILLTIDEMLENAIPRPLNKPAFYPVDRVFAVKGFGAVTTGTLWQGVVKKSEEYEIFPSSKKGKLRGIEFYSAQEDIGTAGNRLALNFQNLSKEEISRGDIITTPNRFSPVEKFDAKVSLLTKIKRKTRVKFHFATTEQEVDYADIGEGFVRIKLEGPLPLARGSRFILRSIAPPDTIGGGEVIDIEPKGKTNNPETLVRLVRIGSMTDEDYLTTILYESSTAGIEIKNTRGLVNWADERFDEFSKSVQAKRLGNRIYSHETIQEWSNKLNQMLFDFFTQNKTRAMITKAEARSRLLPDVDENLFAELLALALKPPLKLLGQEIVDTSREVERSPIEKTVESFFLGELLSPPTMQEIRSNPKINSDPKALEAAFSRLIAEKVIIRADQDVYFHKKAIAKAFQIMKKLIGENGCAKLAQYRDEAKTSRRYAQAILELMDGLGLTRRFGEGRVLGPKGLDI